jgi:hypothetical protein
MINFQAGFPEYRNALEVSGNKEQTGRMYRDDLLAACDWTQTVDSPLDDATKAAWATYRQELRDLPSAEGFPNVAFPTPPSSGE